MLFDFRVIMTPPSTLPSTPIPLYPTGAAALIPAPPTYELIPNRIFVGGFPTSTTDSELREHFEKFFAVKDVKMVKSLDGLSKGYGFITFETEDQAEEIRKLNPKQLEFRNRKLNLGPAIRKINVSGFPPSYAIATPSQLVSSPGSFGYALSAAPSPYGGFSLSAAPQMFVYPPVVNQDANSAPTDQPQQQQQPATPQNSPPAQASPQQQQQQVFFEQEPVRTYANAVSVVGVDKTEPPIENQHSPAPQSLGVNSNSLDIPYQGQQWHGNEQQPQQHPQGDPNNNNNNMSPNGSFYNENYSHVPGQYPPPQQPYPQFQPNGGNDKNGFAPMPLYMNGVGMYQPNYMQGHPNMPPGAQYPQVMPFPYWLPQQKNPYVGYNNYNHQNNWMGPANDMHPHLQNQNQQFHPNYYYPGYHGHQQQQPHSGNDENYMPRPLQPPPPRHGKKQRKASETQEKKKSPNRVGKNHSTPDGKNQKGQKSSNMTPLTNSMQSMSISSPAQ